MRNLMTATETRKAVTVPSSNIISSVELKLRPNLRSLIKEAPAMVGMPIKKQNSAAVVRSRPKSRAPMMVAPEREVPGTRDRT